MNRCRHRRCWDCCRPRRRRPSMRRQSGHRWCWSSLNRHRWSSTRRRPWCPCRTHRAARARRSPLSPARRATARPAGNAGLTIATGLAFVRRPARAGRQGWPEERPGTSTASSSSPDPCRAPQWPDACAALTQADAAGNGKRGRFGPIDCCPVLVRRHSQRWKIGPLVLI